MSFEQRVAEIHAEHSWNENRMSCTCGEGDDRGWEYTADEHDQHFAAVLAAELGITAETALQVTARPGQTEPLILTDPVDIRAARRFWTGEMTDVVRYATTWTPKNTDDRGKP